MNTEHIHIDAEPEDFALLKQKGFPVLCERYRQFDESEKDSLCVFNTNSQKPIPTNLNVELEDSALLDSVQAKYNLLSKREAFHVICNASRGISETANIAENAQMAPSTEIIRSTPKQAKPNVARIENKRELYEFERQRLEWNAALIDKKAEKAKEVIAAQDSYDKNRHERRMKEIAGTAKPTPNGEKIDPESIGDGNCKFQGLILPKTQPCEGALKADAYGFYGNWDWTPEQIAQMERSIPCRGVQTDEEFYENLKLPNIGKHAENLTTESTPKDVIADACMGQVIAK